MGHRPLVVSRRGLGAVVVGLAIGLAASSYKVPPLTGVSFAGNAAGAEKSAAMADVIGPADTLELSGLEDRFQTIAARVSRSVVAISAACTSVDSEDAVRSDDLSAQKLRSMLDHTTRTVGTGFVIDHDGYVLTNEHVVADAQQLWVTTDDHKVYPALVVGTDPRADLAVLKIPTNTLPPVQFADRPVQRGQWTIAVGNPYGLATDGEMAVAVGVVSATQRSLPKLASKEHRLYSDLIQTTAQINPGNSGGPLFDLQGRVIGVNTAVILPQKQTNGIGFALPITQALMSHVEALKQGHEIVYAYLGISIATPTANQRSAAGLREPIGACVESVEANSPADHGHLKAGDLIVRFDGQSVRDGDQLVRLVGDAPVNRAVAVQLYRDGKPMSLSLTLGRREMPAVAVNRSRQRLHWRGLLLGPVPATESKSASGVMIFGVEAGSPFMRQGAAPGAIITAVAGARVADLLSLQKILNTTPAERCQLELSKAPSGSMASIQETP
jgi:serine protease Do